MRNLDPSHFGNGSVAVDLSSMVPRTVDRCHRKVEEHVVNLVGDAVARHLPRPPSPSCPLAWSAIASGFIVISDIPGSRQRAMARNRSDREPGAGGAVT